MTAPTANDRTDRRKAITSFVVGLPGFQPAEFFVGRGTTLPPDHPAVLKVPDMFVSADYADADLPSEYNRVRARQEIAREPKPLPPDKVVVALADFTFRAPGVDGNRFVTLRRGQRLPANSPAVRWNQRKFRRLSELMEAGLIGPHGELRAPTSPTQADDRGGK